MFSFKPKCIIQAGLFLTLTLSTVSGLQARFIRPDLANVPVERLISNMEDMLKQKPKDLRLKYNLARLHAMAYAQKVDSVKVWKGKEQNGAWFGYTPKYIPYKVKKAKTPEDAQRAEKNLKAAVAIYEDVLKTKKDHLGAALGRAWLIEHSGTKEQAVKAYREVIDLAWEKEGKLNRGRLGGNYVTVEAVGYLIPLLDKTKDAQEIAKLERKTAKLKRLPRPITPIAIPLRNNMSVSDIVDPAARVQFDADGSGIAKTWTWIHKDAAWLVNDPHRTGKITSGLQLFGNVTFWCFWDNGYEPLSTLDDNGDGVLSGKELTGLALWRDTNGNGISEPGEVQPIAAWGISELSCQSVTGAGKTCRAMSVQGVTFRDGTVRPSYDVMLQQK